MYPPKENMLTEKTKAQRALHRSIMAPTCHTLSKEEIEAIKDRITPIAEIKSKHGCGNSGILAPRDRKYPVRFEERTKLYNGK